jgi:hypothetical protein
VIDSSRCKHDPPPREFNSRAPDIDAQARVKDSQHRESTPHACEFNSQGRGLDSQSRTSNPHARNTLGAKNEVRALFGPDSDQVASQGLKKKSERSKPKRVFG